MRKAATSLLAGALSAALVLTGVNVPNKSASAASAKLNKDRVVLYVGGNNTAKVKAKNVNQVTYKSKDTSVATVNSTTGKIKAKGPGKTKVVAKTDAGKFKCKVRVYKAIKTLTTDTTEVTLAPGETKTVGVTVKPAKADTSMWEVSTSNKKVAKKQKENGIKGTFDIIGVSEGTATITVSTADGGTAPDATVKVNVVAAEGENTAGKDTDETETLPAEDENTAGEDTDETETPSQAEIVIKENTTLTDAEETEETEAVAALTNSEGTEMYVYYETYNAMGSKLDNPTMSWTIKSDAGETFECEDRSDLGILVIKANVEYGDNDETEIVGGTFTKGNILHIYGESTDSAVTIKKDIVVGEVREITSVDIAGITETVYSGGLSPNGIEFTDPGNVLPFGFAKNRYTGVVSAGQGSDAGAWAGNGTDYSLAFNVYDQNGNVMINYDAVAYNEDGAASDKLMIGTEDAQGNILDVSGIENENIKCDAPAALSSVISMYQKNEEGSDDEWVAENNSVAEETIGGCDYFAILLSGGSDALVGGLGFFLLSGGTGGGYTEYEYTVGTTTGLVSLELAAPTTRVHDGEGAAIGMNGIFEDGTVYENISVAKLKKELGSDTLDGVYVTASEVESSGGLGYNRKENTVEDSDLSTYAGGSSPYSLDLSGETAVLEWTDTVTDPYGDQNIFDDAVRTIRFEATNSSEEINVEGLDLKVYDPSRPVDVELSSWDSGAIRVEGTDEIIKFIDQFGETMAEDVDDVDEMKNVMSFFSYAMKDGYVIGEKTTYFGIALVTKNTAEPEAVVNIEDIGSFEQSANFGGSYGVSWSSDVGESFNNAAIEIVECDELSAGDDITETLVSQGEPAGKSALLGTVKIYSYTFTASGVGGTLQCLSGSNNWNFKGVIYGTVAKCRRNVVVGNGIDATADFSDGVTVDVSLKDQNGKECEDSENCSDHGGNSSVFTASFSVSVTSALGNDKCEYEVEEIDVNLSASANGKSTYAIRGCFRDEVSVFLVS